MRIIATISETRAYIEAKKKAGKTIGFVPTMGALHEGHISLIERAKAENDVVLCSIFVNPIQFTKPEDLKKYPRTLEKDALMLEPAGCDAIFAPSVEEMYGTSAMLKMDFGSLETVMEGKFRPGHFNGVGIVVAKLFHIVQPDRAYFGLKDLQQVAVIKCLVRDLSFPITLVPCPTLREKDGLAMSSRNMRLSPEARALAHEVYKTLNVAKNAILAGKNAKNAKVMAKNYMKKISEFGLEYIEISDFDTLMPLKERAKEGQTAICIATFLGGVRLIDNVVF